jgi:hypothetical protein
MLTPAYLELLRPGPRPTDGVGLAGFVNVIKALAVTQKNFSVGKANTFAQTR